MAHQDPANVPLITYVWVVGLSLLSSVAGYLSRINSGKPVNRPAMQLLQDVCYCELAGLSSYFMAQTAELSEMQAILVVALGSHMGARLIFLMQNMLTRQLRTGIEAREEE